MTNIIALSGYANSGKDLCGKIIQYLCSASYHKHKMTYYEFCDIFLEPDKISSWKIKKFALPVKQIASILTGIPIAKFEDQDFKNQPLSEEWNYKTKHPGYEEQYVQMTARRMLQLIGTECMRDNLHENTWVNALFAQSNSFEKWVITDLRFPNEYEAIKKRDGITIRINRNIYPNDPIVSTLHPSETALDSYEFDYIIDNNSSIEDLIQKIRKILIKEQIIHS